MQDEEQKPTSLIDPEKDLKLKAYLVKFKDRVEMWAKAHSKELHVASNPPIYWDDTLRDFVWMNRETRRIR